MPSGDGSATKVETGKTASQDESRGAVIFKTDWSSGNMGVIVVVSLVLLFLIAAAFMRINDLDQMSKQNNQTITDLLTSLAARNNVLRSQPTGTQNPAAGQQSPAAALPAGAGVGSAAPSAIGGGPSSMTSQPLPTTSGAGAEPAGQPVGTTATPPAGGLR